MRNFAIIVLFVLPVFLFAQEKVDIFEMSLDELLKMTVESASKISQEPKEAPGNIQNIQMSTAETYGWESINEILSNQAGFSLTHDYDRETISSRGVYEGWNNNHYLLLIDGVPYNDNLYGTAYTWGITPLIFSESMELITGPGSALYGTNATNGVVSLKTIDPSASGEKNYIQFQGGTQKTRSFDILSSTVHNYFSMVNSFSYGETDGNEYNSLDWSGRVDAQGNMQEFKINDNQTHKYFFSKVSGQKQYKPFELQFHYQEWEFQTGHGWWWSIPDYDESMKEFRLMTALTYKPESNGKLSQEYVVRYQNHMIDWNMMYMPNDGWGGYYPAGMWEYLKTNGEDLFLRAQFDYSLQKNASVLGGVEETVFFYDNDDEHFSNVNISGAAMTDSYGNQIDPDAPFVDGRMMPMGPWFEWIQDHPVYNTGVFAQFASGDMIHDAFEVTGGVRFDLQNFTYNDLDNGNKEESKSFSQVSPRLAFVYSPSEKYSVKLLMGKAFRAPAPTEMFGANTWTLASNLKNLDPEIITTGEMVAHINFFKNVKIKANGYWTKFENQIGYSASNTNLSTNIFNMTNVGFETDAMFSYKSLKGYANYSFTQRMDEEITEINGLKDHSVHSDEMMWYPVHSVNFGAMYRFDKLTCSLSSHFQGKVLRRDSDLISYSDIRDPELDAWMSFDTKVEYKLNTKIGFYLKVKNLLDTERKIVKSGDIPFDYKLEERKILLGMNFDI